MSSKLKPTVLKKRPEFLAVAATGKKWVTPGLILQLGAAKQQSALRYGLTATTKIGNAVIRNKAKRRLRSLAMEILPQYASPFHDYVLIARITTVTRNYEYIRKDFLTALKKLGALNENNG